MGHRQGCDDLVWVTGALSFPNETNKTHKKGRKGSQEVLSVHNSLSIGEISLYLQVNNLERKGDTFCRVHQGCMAEGGWSEKMRIKKKNIHMEKAHSCFHCWQKETVV